jgi:YbbR domain-containing protein
MAIVKLSAIERRRLSVFVTCLVLAVIAWVFSTLSNPYYFVMKEVMNFKNAPQKRAFHALQSDTIDVTVQGTGWQMLFSKINLQGKGITVDLASLDTKNFIVLNSQLGRINASHELDHEIISFDPDTLYFDFTNRVVKRVPVKLVSNLAYEPQFGTAGQVTIKPAYVTVSGPGNVVSKITSWNTDTLKQSRVSNTLSARVNLQPVKEGNLNIFPKTVQVKIPVDEFTEKTLDIPVKLINNSSYYNVKIFPQKVRVTFTTSLSRYAETIPDLFEATADLSLWKNNGYKVLPVKLTTIPAYCKIVSIEPNNIDFITKK